MNPHIHIAVVDDDPMILRVFSAMMTQAHMHADTFVSPHQAFEAMTLNPQKYDLLITDIYMPGGDGVEFARKIRSILPNLPIMFMTGNAVPEKREEALALGRVEFLEKPFPILEALHEMITKFVGKT